MNKDTFAETQIQDFFNKLKEIYVEGVNSRLDFLACHAMSYIYTDSMILVKELEKMLQVSEIYKVKMSNKKVCCQKENMYAQKHLHDVL